MLLSVGLYHVDLQPEMLLFVGLCSVELQSVMLLSVSHVVVCKSVSC